ncbi:hypothetical protein SAMN05444396_10352 [Flavobacterium segetis]|uniref:Uncharacterized protein n=1 Tax=Flavobacterium segetis TaxID=271157 RepID=A0A1M5FU97_9FLAO|nr:hypothetical protein [Flavobacterium segetis]SHF95147.1 hypothetical protein SAMN05444396_10352 [Flavobacterium segetis]
MKGCTSNQFLGILLLLLFSNSCASDLDFDQVNNFKTEPVVVANLASFDIQASQFIVNGVEQNVIFDAPTIQLFNDSFFKRRLKKVELFFELENTINRAYSLNLFFLDINNQPVHVLNLAIPSYSGAENKTTKTDIFENVQLDLLKRTTKIAFIMTISPGKPLTKDSVGSLKLRSSVTAYLVVE